jgi:hypothetical protein
VEKKNTNKIRECIDFCNLNKATPKDEYLMPIADMLIEGPGEATGRGVNGSRIKFFCKNWHMSQVQTLKEGGEHTNQQRTKDPLKVTNAAKKEWDQLDTRLAKYGQNSEQISY